MNEDERILEDRYSRMTWKGWAIIAAVQVVIYSVIYAIRSTG